MSDSSDEDYRPGRHELEAAELDEHSSSDDGQQQQERLQRQQLQQQGVETDETGPDSGYTTGFTTGDDDDDEPHDIFDAELNPLQLLQQMQMQSAGDPTALQPYQVLRTQKAATRRRQFHRDSDEEDDDEGTHEAMEVDEAGPGPSSRGTGISAGTGRGTGRPRGRPRKQRQEELSGPEGPSSSRRRGGGGGGSGAVFGADIDEILNDPLAAQIGLVPGKRRKKKKRKSKGGGEGGGVNRRQIPQEISKKLGEANLLYATKQYKQAADLMMEVIKECPNIADPFHTLGLIYEGEGNPRRALDFFMIAAHLTPKDIPLWKRLAALSTQLGFFRQAIYCLNKVISRDKRDLDARWDRAVLFAEVNETSKAISQFQQISQMRPGDPEVPKMVARLHHRMGNPNKASEVLERHMREHPESTDFTHVNILAELFMDAGLFEKTYMLIDRAESVLEGEDVGGMPMDLTVKAGLCLAHLGRPEESDSYLASLLNESPELYGDLYLDVGNAFIAMGRHEKALTFLQRLQAMPDYMDPALWERLVVCYRALGQLQQAVNLYQDKLSLMGTDHPKYSEVCLKLAELHAEQGQGADALQLLQRLKQQGFAQPQQLQQQLDPQHATAARAPDGAAAGAEAPHPPGAEGAATVTFPALPSEAGGAGAGDPAASPLDRQASVPPAPQGAPSAAVTPAGSETGGDGDAGLPEGLASAVAAAAAAASSLHVPKSTEDMAQFMRRSKLLLQLGRMDEFASGAAPLIEHSLAILEADSAAVTDPDLNPDVLKAMLRRRHIMGRGGRKGAGAAETESVFKGETRRDRRSSKTLDADMQAEAYIQRMGGLGPELGGRRGASGAPAVCRSMLVDEEFFGLFLTLCRALLQQGREAEAVTLLSRACELCNQQPRWFGPATRDQLFIALADALACPNPRVQQPAQALTLLRGLCSRWPYSLAVWSRYSHVSAGAGGVRSWGQTVSAMRRKWPTSVPVMIMQGHVHNMARNFPEALSEYFHAYRFLPSEPLLLMCIGVAFLNLATGRKVPDRNRAVLQGFAFLQDYARRRMVAVREATAQAGATGGASGAGRAGSPAAGWAAVSAGLPWQPALMGGTDGTSGGGRGTSGTVGSSDGVGDGGGDQGGGGDKGSGGGVLDPVSCCAQEVAYNIGRAAHHLGLSHIALNFYLKALGSAPWDDEANVGEEDGEGEAGAGADGKVAGGSGEAGNDMDVDGEEEQQQGVASGSGTLQGREAGGHEQAAAAARGPLTRQAAYNLANIYQASGAVELAREVYRTYLVI